jgi:hypothetical protein
MDVKLDFTNMQNLCNLATQSEKPRDSEVSEMAVVIIKARERLLTGIQITHASWPLLAAGLLYVVLLHIFGNSDQDESSKNQSSR